MADTAENKTDTIEISETQSDEDREKRPIMILLQRLIRNKQNTVMTNTQILEILKREFDIDVVTCHELELDIYIKIIKKYLKDWPQWEDLERIASKLSSANDLDAVSKVLDHKYKKLKEYLGVMLDAAKQSAKKAVLEVEPDANKEVIIDSDVVMEVYCTRDQLTHLVYKRPQSPNNSILNITKIEPTRIILNTLSFESILNYWWTKIYINLPFFAIIRELTHKYKHTLVNKVRNETPPVEELDLCFYNRCKKFRECEKKTIFQYFDKILMLCKKDEHVHQLVEVIIHIFKKDMADAPEILKVPSTYRKYANRYKYIRYLNAADDASSCSKYDLSLEEIMAPTFQFFIGRAAKSPEAPLLPIQEWLKIECMMCKVKFAGSTELMSVVQAHFNDYHQHEADWQCTHCKRLFSMDFLSKNRWYHEC